MAARLMLFLLIGRNMRTPTKQEFLNNVAPNKMEILRDDVGYRHIQFKTQVTGFYSFERLRYG